MIVIDTHVLLWWFGGDRQRISQPAWDALQAEMQGGTILISSISAWEIALLSAKGRIGLSSDVSSWLEIVERVEAIQFVPVDNQIAILSAQLDGLLHKDPADRILVATSMRFLAPLVTMDDKIRNFARIRTIW